MKKKKDKNMHYKEDSSTSLVGMIGIFIVLISFIGNSGNIKAGNIKSNIAETTFASSDKKDVNMLELGEQTIRIDGKEYIITVKGK